MVPKVAETLCVFLAMRTLAITPDGQVRQGYHESNADKNWAIMDFPGFNGHL
jgi:hypothetical protein